MAGRDLARWGDLTLTSRCGVKPQCSDDSMLNWGRKRTRTKPGEAPRWLVHRSNGEKGSAHAVHVWHSLPLMLGRKHGSGEAPRRRICARLPSPSLDATVLRPPAIPPTAPQTLYSLFFILSQSGFASALTGPWPAPTRT